MAPGPDARWAGCPSPGVAAAPLRGPLALRLGMSTGHRHAERDAVIDLLAGQDCALSALDIEDRLREGGRRVARASVYRVLELLVAHRLVQRLDVGEGMARYEPAHPDGEHHHHLVCGLCNRLVPFHDAALERIIERLSDESGFRVDDHEVVLHGACERCRDR
jgi:Fur family ferric uptake transcriptional regulator